MEVIWSNHRRATWEAAGPDVPLQQHWAWGEVLRTSGAMVERAVISDGAGPVALAQTVMRRFGPVSVALVARGPTWLRETERPAALGALRQALPLRRPRVLLVTEDQAEPSGLVPLVTAAHVAEVDVSPPLARLRAGLDGKWRNRLRAAERSGLTVRRDDRSTKSYRWLLEAEAQQSRQRRYRGLPPDLAARWHELEPRRLRVYTVRSGGDRVAAMLFLLHGRRATYQIGWSGPDGRAASAHNLCLWHAIAELRNEGIGTIDLGTVDTQRSPGLARFKIGAGARVRPLGPTAMVPPTLIRWPPRAGS